ncbi:MAG: flagellar motor protein MotA [Rhodospirillaceae bacterium]|jgi:chemotaxis protein MotA|nr:flagellar motor protein MotA [Rhodospirillaceae bacterium]
MSIATIVGLLVSVGLVIGSIMLSTDNYLLFLHLASFAMVVGGTLGATFISYEPRYVILSLKLVMKILYAPEIGRDMLKAEVGRLIRWAYAVQKNGPVALEAESKKAVRSDKFLKFGVDCVISGYTGDEVREIMGNFVENTYGRNMAPVNIMKDMAASAPAFGMVGTLVGLIIMLDNMGGDPSELGKGLAVAMLTTLYGVLFSRVLFMPAASKMAQRESILRFRNYIVVEGLVLLAEKKSPRYIQDRLNGFLDPSIHFNIDKMKR